MLLIYNLYIILSDFFKHLNFIYSLPPTIHKVITKHIWIHDHILVFDVRDLIILPIYDLYSDRSWVFRKYSIDLFRNMQKPLDVAYQLELPNKMIIHNIFHILCLLV